MRRGYMACSRDKRWACIDRDEEAMSSEHSDSLALLQQAAAWQAAGRKVAVATVVHTWGSSPRPAGSMLVVNEDSAFVGSVSGGCIEGAVVGAALASMQDGQPRLLSFGITHDRAWEVGLACGGQVEVFVRALGDVGPDAERYAALRDALAKRQPVVLLTAIPDAEQRLVTLDPGAVSAALGLPQDDALAPLIKEALRSEKCQEGSSLEGPAASTFPSVSTNAPSAQGTVDSQQPASRRWLIQPFCPPARLVIVGAVHIAQRLSQMAALAGFAVVVIDPRTAFASEARFPGVDLRTTWPAQALAAVGVDARTAVVTLTHDPKLDDPALEVALRSQAFYVGSLGSGKTHAARCNRLRTRGFSDEEIARIHGPVGLKIGARSPSEIAVSILAELICTLRSDRP